MASIMQGPSPTPVVIRPYNPAVPSPVRQPSVAQTSVSSTALALVACTPACLDEIVKILLPSAGK